MKVEKDRDFVKPHLLGFGTETTPKSLCQPENILRERTFISNRLSPTSDDTACELVGGTSVKNALCETLLEGLIEASSFRRAESGGDHHVRTTPLEPVENPQEWFVVRDRQHFIEFYLVKENDICGEGMNVWFNFSVSRFGLRQTYRQDRGEHTGR